MNNNPILMQDLGMQYPTKTSKRKARFGLYKCSCGTDFRAMFQSIRNGNTLSCGCYQKERVKQSNTRHGMKKHRLYDVWNKMIDRTINKHSKDFKNYGARGITVCERWKDINNFIEDMYPTFKEGLSIDRKDNDGNYEPSNCRWTTYGIQCRNSRLIRATNKSGYRGVSFGKHENKWVSQISVNGKTIRIGSFITALEAAKAYDNYVIKNNLEHTINGAKQ